MSVSLCFILGRNFSKKAPIYCFKNDFYLFIYLFNGTKDYFYMNHKLFKIINLQLAIFRVVYRPNRLLFLFTY